MKKLVRFLTGICVGLSLSLSLGAMAVREPAAAQYRIFADRASAVRYFEHYEAVFFARQKSAPVRRILPDSDPRYARLQTLVDRVFKDFKEHYPLKLSGIDRSPVALLVEDAEVNAYALGPLADDGDKRLPYLFIVHTATLGGEVTESEYTGLIAHELTHLFFAHMNVATIQGLRKFYRVSAGQSEPLGSEQLNDSAVERVASMWIAYGALVGPLSYPELHGLPTVKGPARYYDLLRFMRLSYASAGRAACAGVEAAAQNWVGVVKPLTERKERGVEPSGTELKQLDLVSLAYVNELRACFAGVHATLGELLARQYGVDAKKMSAVLENDSASAAFDRENNPIDGLTAAVGLIQGAMEKLDLDPNLRGARFYSHEEQADDFGTLALQHLQLNPAGLANFLFNHGLTPAEREDCARDLRAGKVPAYGFLVDDHHGTCFRIFHLTEFNRRLQRGVMAR